MNFLYDHPGQRKYLTAAERVEFLKSAKRSDSEICSFCATLAYTGTRISEVLALVPDRFDFSDDMIIIESFKKRRRGINRAVPIPQDLMNLLDELHHIRRRQSLPEDVQERIWLWSRTTAWKRVKDTMSMAGLTGPWACPKGLRHCFGVTAIQNQTPINMVRKWLGHSRISTTALYADAVGDEERKIAERFWKDFE